MAISSFFGLQTALRGLQAHQQALDTTAHNIGNASTPGYSRQQAVLKAADPLTLPGITANGGIASLGAGVDVASFQRVRDAFADLQYRAQSMALGQYETTATKLSETETSLSEPSDNGIGAVLAKFWSSWDDLANHPEQPATRQALVDQANLLTDRINTLQGTLSQVRTEAQTEYATITGPSGDVASYAQEIAQLNASIKSAVQQGNQPNDLMDRRDLAIDNLAKLAQVSVTDLGQGTIQVNFGDAAQPLVNDTTVTWPQTLTTPGGQLGALLKLGDTTAAGTITSYMAGLDGVASSLISSVNALHGAPPFFSGTDAATIGVNVTAATVQAATPPAAAGANDIALAMSALRGGTADTAYANLVARIGGDARAANQQQQTTQALVDAADDRRQSASGVSMDEEMTNMVRFQRGYQASARVMSTMDEMLDTLINRTGRVGL
jgi:flagellar hook-associated protein 1 FlgK